MRMRTLVVAAFASLALSLAAAGCGDDDGGTNDNTTEHLSDDLLQNVDGTPDFGCEGQADPALSFPVETEISGVVRDFETKWEVEGVLVSIYSTVQDLLDDNPYDTSAPSAPNGSYSVLAPPDVPRLHFKIFEETVDEYVVTMELNEPVAGLVAPPQATGKDRQIVSQSTFLVVPSLLGIDPIPGRGIVSGRVFGCGGLELENAAIRIFDGPESDPDRQLISLVEGDFRNTFYFPRPENPNDPPASLPGRDAMFTDAEGRFLTANLIATPGEFVTVEAWGRHAGCPDGCMVSTQEVPVLPDSIIMTDLLPHYAQ